MALTYLGHYLSDENIQKIIKVANKYKFPIDYAITLLHFEGLWGNSTAGKEDNNWGGMTYIEGESIRPSGIKVIKGTERPKDEGGHYMRYESIDDFLEDWAYLLRAGGIYKVSGTNTFDEAILGMFKVGGAKYDYAAIGYEKYLKRMQDRRSDINNDNNQYLDKIIQGDDKMATTKTAADVVNHARKYLGTTESSSNFTNIINTYNNHLPLAQGVEMLKEWEWCACFVSFIAIELGITDLIGTEIGVERFINNIFKAKGIWMEDGTITPVQGDIITWNWDQRTQPNDGFADHIGFVDYVKNGYIYTVEGNTNEKVGSNAFKIGDGRIRGYARPKYAKSSSSEEVTSQFTTVSQHFIVAIDNLRAFDIPSGSGKIVENIKKNYVKNIDLLVEAEGYVWGGWISSADYKRRWTTLKTADGIRKLVELREGTIGHGGKTIQEYEAALKQEVTPAPDQSNRELKENEFKIDGKIYEVNEVE